MSADTLMANWFCFVFNVVCRQRLSSQRCRSELIESAWVVIVPGQKCKTNTAVNYVKRKERNYMLISNEGKSQIKTFWKIIKPFIFDNATRSLLVL